MPEQLLVLELRRSASSSWEKNMKFRFQNKKQELFLIHEDDKGEELHAEPGWKDWEVHDPPIEPAWEDWEIHEPPTKPEWEERDIRESPTKPD